MEKVKLVIMGSWNTDGGVSRHTTPIAEWLIEQGYEVKVFTHYKESTHGYPLDVADEDFVIRCFTASGEGYPEKVLFNPAPLLKTVEEQGYNIFLAEDLGTLPMEGLLKVFPRIKARAKTILLNHDNAPKSANSPFWRFDWDAIVNFLPEQDKFMKKYYSPEKIHCIAFPAYPLSKGNKEISRKELNLPADKIIILTFGEYNMVDFLPVLSRMRKDNPSFYLLALVYNEDKKIQLEDTIKNLIIEKGYDEIRVENGSWQQRREYVFASNIIIFDKGKGIMGSGAILSSTAYQVSGWGTPILARDNLYFSPFQNGELVTYKSDKQLRQAVQTMLYDDRKREQVILKAYEFAVNHSPGRTSVKFLEIFHHLLGQGKLKRYNKNPILKPIKEHSWESKLVFNCGAIRLKGKTYLAYRALGDDAISRIGLAITEDGYHIAERLPDPILEPKLDELPDAEILQQRHRERGGYEDPRMFIIGDRIYLTYVLFHDTCLGKISSIDIDDFINRKWDKWQDHGLIFPDFDERGAVLFEFEGKDGKNHFAAYHRDTKKKSINLAVSDEITFPWSIVNDKPVLLPGASDLWDDGKEGRMGTGSQAIESDYGWLSFYHAHREDEFTNKKVYRLGVFLSSLNDPSQIIYRSHIPVLEPEMDYELSGWVNNVVFTCGAVPKNKDSTECLNRDDEILVYYAAADNVICIAEAKLSEIIPV